MSSPPAAIDGRWVDGAVHRRVQQEFTRWRVEPVSVPHTSLKRKRVDLSDLRIAVFHVAKSDHSLLLYKGFTFVT